MPSGDGLALGASPCPGLQVGKGCQHLWVMAVHSDPEVQPMQDSAGGPVEPLVGPGKGPRICFSPSFQATLMPPMWGPNTELLLHILESGSRFSFFFQQEHLWVVIPTACVILRGLVMSASSLLGMLKLACGFGR